VVNVSHERAQYLEVSQDHLLKQGTKSLADKLQITHARKTVGTARELPYPVSRVLFSTRADINAKWYDIKKLRTDSW